MSVDDKKEMLDNREHLFMKRFTLDAGSKMKHLLEREILIETNCRLAFENGCGLVYLRETSYKVLLEQEKTCAKRPCARYTVVQARHSRGSAVGWL